jgi:hypothetical protein
MSTEQRLAALERTVRFQRFSLVAIVAAGGVAMLVGAGANNTFDKLTVKQLIVVDGKGRDVAEFAGLKNGGVSLVLRHDPDKPSQSVVIESTTESSLITTSFADGSSGTMISLPSGTLVSATNGKSGVRLLSERTAAKITLEDEKARERIVVAAADKLGGNMGIIDDKGKLVWRAP